MRYALITVAFALLSTPALAQDPRWYIGVGIGQSTVEDFCDGAPAGVGCDEKDTATRIFGGYQFNRNFALEAGYTDLGQASADFPGMGSVSLGASGFEFMALGIAPLGERWSLYGKLGLFAWDIDVSDSTGLVGNFSESGTDLTYGFGVGVDFTKRWGARFEYQVYSDIGNEDTTGTGDVSVLGASLLYRF